MEVGWTVCMHNCSLTLHNLLAHTAPRKPGLTETQNFFASVEPIYSRAFGWLYQMRQSQVLLQAATQALILQHGGLVGQLPMQ